MQEIRSATNVHLNPPPAYKNLLHRTRFVVLALGFVCSTLLHANFLVFTTNVTCFPRLVDETEQYSNETSNLTISSSFHRNPATDLYSTSQIYASFLVAGGGVVVGIFPTAVLVQKLNIRRVVTGFGLLSAFATGFLPLTALIDFHLLLLARFLQGFCLWAGFSLTQSATLNWTTQKHNELNFFLSLTVLQAASVLTTTASGVFCLFAHWSVVYYFQATLTFCFFIFFFIFYRETPIKHSFVSATEFARIQRDHPKKPIVPREPPRLRKIFSTPPIIAVLGSAFASFLGLQVILQFSQLFVFKALDVSSETSSIAGVAIQAAAVVGKFIIVFADRRPILPPEISVRIFNSICLAGMASTFLGLAFTQNKSIGMVLLLLANFATSFSFLGFLRTSALVAKQQFGLISTSLLLLNCLASLLAPALLALFVDNASNWRHWRSVWWVLAGLAYFAAAAFCLVARTQPAAWAQSASASLGVAPVSHPRPGAFTAAFNDRVTVTIQTKGLDRCETCRRHGVDAKVHPKGGDPHLPSRRQFDVELDEHIEPIAFSHL